MGVQGLRLLNRTAFAWAVPGTVVGNTEVTAMRECTICAAAEGMTGRRSVVGLSSCEVLLSTGEG